jgi:predicted porin
MGYVRRVDLRAVSEYAEYLWYPGGNRVLSFGPSMSVSADWDHQQQLQDWNTYPTFVINFPRQTSIKVATSRNYELYEGIGFRSTVNELSAYSAPARSFGISASLTKGQAVNYAPAAGLAPFLGGSTGASLGWTWRPAERVRIENFYYYTRLGDSDSAGPAAGADRRTVFDNHLARLKLNYQFTRALSLRTILDYYALQPDQTLIDYTPAKAFTGDVLLTYLIHPGTALYIGYTNRMENVAIDPAVPLVRLTGSAGTVTNRQIFMKVSYLLRF